MSSFCQHLSSPSSCLRSPRALLLLSILITSASTCSGSKSQSSIVNGIGEWEFGRAADADSRTNKRTKADLDSRKLTGQSHKVQHDGDEAPTSLNVAGTSTRPPIRALRQSRRFKLFLPSTVDGSSSSTGATAADALDRYLGSGENDIFFSHSFSHSYDDDSSEEHDSDESSDSGDSTDIAADNAPEEDSFVPEEDAIATMENGSDEIAWVIGCSVPDTIDDLAGDDSSTALEFKYEVKGDVDANVREKIAEDLRDALAAAFPNCGSNRRRELQSVDSSIYQVRRTTGTEGVRYIEVTSETSEEACTVLSNDGENCSVETGAATAVLYDSNHATHVKGKMRESVVPIFENAANGGEGIPEGVTVHVIEPNDQIELASTTDRSDPQVTKIMVPQEASASTSTLSPAALTFGCVGALFFGIAVALLQYRRKRSQLGSDDDSASNVSIWSAKPPALAAGESDDESATTALSHAPVEPTNLPIPGAPASSPIVMVKMYGDGKNTVETTAPDYLPPNVPPAICFELMEEKRATPASCAITIDDSEI